MPSDNLLTNSSLTIGSANSNSSSQEKTTAKFHQLFPQMRDFPLIDHFSCAFQREILAHGRLYLTGRGICFYASIFGWVTKLCVHFEEVIQIEKKATAHIFQNAIQIKTLHAKLFFASFNARDSTYLKLVTAWRACLLHLDLTAGQIKGVSGKEVAFDCVEGANPFWDDELDKRRQQDDEITLGNGQLEMGNALKDSSFWQQNHATLQEQRIDANAAASLNQLSVRSVDELKEYFWHSNDKKARLELQMQAQEEVQKNQQGEEDLKSVLSLEAEIPFIQRKIDANALHLYKIMVKEPKMLVIQRFLLHRGYLDTFLGFVGRWKCISNDTFERSLILGFKIKIFNLHIGTLQMKGWQQVVLESEFYDSFYLETHFELPLGAFWFLRKCFLFEAKMKVKMQNAFQSNVQFWMQVSPNCYCTWICKQFIEQFMEYLQEISSSSLPFKDHSRNFKRKNTIFTLNFTLSLALLLFVFQLILGVLFVRRCKANPISIAKSLFSAISNPRNNFSFAAQSAREEQIHLLDQQITDFLLVHDK